jgi:hypothetical protein
MTFAANQEDISIKISQRIEAIVVFVSKKKKQHKLKSIIQEFLNDTSGFVKKKKMKGKV